MELIILGSGGFQSIPRPTCTCRICNEARMKGVPYSRNGPSIYIKEINAIVDTPKDIIQSLNRENIGRIEHIFLTHWHPDHTEGLRVAEEITSTWNPQAPYVLKNHGNPIIVFASTSIMNQIRKLQSPLGSYLSYYEKQQFLVAKELDCNRELSIQDIHIMPIMINTDEKLSVCAYQFASNGKRAIYMPCDVKPHVSLDFLKNADLFMVNCPFLESREGFPAIPPTHPLREELFSMEEVRALVKKYAIKKTIIVHIEEMWRLSFAELAVLEKKYHQDNIHFSYDGMNIIV